MPRFFFDIDNGIERRDDIGCDCASTADAQGVAIRLVSEFAKGLTLPSDSGDVLITVRDDPQSVSMVMRFTCQIETHATETQAAA